MNVKKLAIAGAMVLIIVGCVLAAGCTSSTSTSTDPIVGTWGASFTEHDIGISATTFFANGTGTELMLYPNEGKDTYTFTWKKTGDKTYQCTYSDGSVWGTTIVDDEQPLVWKSVDNKDQIIGTWPGTYVENGEKISDLTTFNPDFTGVSIGTFVDSPNKEKLNEAFTWAKTGKDTYVMIYNGTSRWFATYDKEKKSVSFKKVDYAQDPILGTHFDNETEFIVNGRTTYVFSPNGFGSEVQTSEKGIELGKYNFIWEKEEANNYSLSYPSSEIWEFWTLTYNPQTNTIDDWNLEQYAWVDNYREGGNHLLDIDLYEGVNGLAYEFDGTGKMDTYQTTWEITGLHTFKVTYDDGDVWYATYLPLANTYEWKQAEK